MRERLLFLAALGLGTAFFALTTVRPSREKAARMEAREEQLQAEVEALEADVRLLRKEVLALQEDPWFIERILRRHAREGTLPPTSTTSEKK